VVRVAEDGGVVPIPGQVVQALGGGAKLCEDRGQRGLVVGFKIGIDAGEADMIGRTGPMPSCSRIWQGLCSIRTMGDRRTFR
jgi:hypothetical protein